MLQRLLTLLPVIAFSFSISGCLFHAFHPPIQQGNIITDNKVNAIKRGMSVNQVQNVLGTPVLKNIYPNGQLAYVYSLRQKGKLIHKRYLVVYFRNGRVYKKDSQQDWPNLPLPVK